MSNIAKFPCEITPKPDCLRDKIILVTGAGDGIGRVAALSFAEYGATVILLGKTESKLESVYDEIETKKYPQPSLCTFDLNTNDPASYKALAAVIEKDFGRLDGLLHNAAILGARNSIESYKPKQWMEVMQVNINAPFLLTQALMPLLKKSNSASILFTSSGVGRQGKAYWGAYSVSKFAIEGLMQVLSDELQGCSSIRANSINPGPTRTDMRASAFPAENPQTIKTPESLMPYYLYLMSDLSWSENGKSFEY